MTSHAPAFASESAAFDARQSGCHSPSVAAPIDWQRLYATRPESIREDTAMDSPRALLDRVRDDLAMAEAGCYAVRELRIAGRYKTADEEAAKVAQEVRDAAWRVSRLMVRPLTLEPEVEALRVDVAAFVDSFVGWW